MSLTDAWINAYPVWVSTVGVIALSLAAFVLGQWVAAHPHWLRGDPDREQEGYIIAALTGLLALLLGFTFAIAVERFEARRMLVIEEANVIKLTFLRTETLEQPYRNQLQTLLRRYIRNRLTLSRPQDEDEAVRGLLESRNLQISMWNIAVAAIGPERDDVDAAFLGSMSTLVEIGVHRKFARQAHVPPRIFTILLIYMTVSSGVLGFAIGRRYRGATVVVIMLSCMSYLLILDIDEPLHGAVRESQVPMEELLEMKAANRVSAPRP